jgi:tRNA1(Val) A37 N6-methylase TrmN6
MGLVTEMKLSVLRLRMIHNNIESPATMFMAELAKGRRSTPVVEPPQFVRDLAGKYCEVIKG